MSVLIFFRAVSFYTEGMMERASNVEGEEYVRR
jgi:hypothetical protein